MPFCVKSQFALYFLKICDKIKNDSLVGTCSKIFDFNILTVEMASN